MSLYLASTSPRRRELLRRLNIEFRLLRPRTDEAAHVAGNGRLPRRAALACARAKAVSVEHRVKSGLVVGVDTIVVLEREVMGKPADAAQATRMLERLSGRTHKVVSGVVVLRLPDRRLFSGAESTQVSFRRMSAAEIRDYVATREPYDKAGAYGIQERAAIFVSRVRGCYLNVVGLPVPLLLRLLGRAGWRR